MTQHTQILEESEEILVLASRALAQSCDLLNASVRQLALCRNAQVRHEEHVAAPTVFPCPARRKGSSPFVLPASMRSAAFASAA